MLLYKNQGREEKKDYMQIINWGAAFSVVWCSPERRRQLDHCQEVLGFITAPHISCLMPLFTARMPQQGTGNGGHSYCKVSILIAFHRNKGTTTQKNTISDHINFSFLYIVGTISEKRMIYFHMLQGYQRKNSLQHIEAEA